MGRSSQPAQQTVATGYYRGQPCSPAYPRSKTNPRYKHPCDGSSLEAAHPLAAPGRGEVRQGRRTHGLSRLFLFQHRGGPALSNATATKGQGISYYRCYHPTPHIPSPSWVRDKMQGWESDAFEAACTASFSLRRSRLEKLTARLYASSFLGRDGSQAANRGSFRWQGRVAVTGSFPPL